MLPKEFIKMQKVAGLITESQLEEVQSEYYQELVNNWKSDGVDYEAAVVELERMGLDTGTAENIVTQIYGEEPEELSEEKTPLHFSGIAKTKIKLEPEKIDILNKQWPNWSFKFKPYDKSDSNYKYYFSYDSDNTNDKEIEKVKKFVSLFLKLHIK